MPQFEMKVFLPANPACLSSDLLCMSGVNYELSPILKMSVPEKWATTSISDWPINEELFSSKVLFFGFIPIDLHSFTFLFVNTSGFKESSKTLINSVWSHERTISNNGSGAIVSDVIYFKSKLGFLGYLFKPVSQAIFAHRHKRLILKYAKNS